METPGTGANDDPQPRRSTGAHRPARPAPARRPAHRVRHAGAHSVAKLQATGQTLGSPTVHQRAQGH